MAGDAHRHRTESARISAEINHDAVARAQRIDRAVDGGRRAGEPDVEIDDADADRLCWRSDFNDARADRDWKRGEIAKLLSAKWRGAECQGDIALPVGGCECQRACGTCLSFDKRRACDREFRTELSRVGRVRVAFARERFAKSAQLIGESRSVDGDDGPTRQNARRRGRRIGRDAKNRCFTFNERNVEAAVARAAQRGCYGFGSFFRGSGRVCVCVAGVGRTRNCGLCARSRCVGCSARDVCFRCAHLFARRLNRRRRLGDIARKNREVALAEA